MMRFGVIGCGGVAGWHIDAISELPEAELTAVCDVNAGHVSKITAKFNCAGFSQGEDLIKSGLADAVCICTPSGSHAELCIMALENGVHAVAEKPLAITRQSLRAVLDAESKSSQKLMVISQLRYGRDIVRARDLISSGALGKISIADLSMKYYRVPSYYSSSDWRGTLANDGGGALMNQGIHGVDILRYLCGDMSTVHCFSKTLVHDIEVEDTLTASFELSSGAIGTLSATTSCYPGQERRIEICGSKGSVTIVEDMITYLKLESGESYKAERKDGPNTASDPFASNHALHALQLDAFISGIAGGTATPVNGADAAGTLNIIFSLYESASCGSPVTL